MAIGLQLSLLGGWLKEGKGEGERKGIGGGEEGRSGGGGVCGNEVSLVSR